MITRRQLLRRTVIATPSLLLTGCDQLGASPTFRDLVLGSGEWLSYRVQRLIGGAALAREYDEAEMSPKFRTNGNIFARSPEWQAHAEAGFIDWRLKVDGLVERPTDFSLATLRAMPSRTQITRHDCVEGWSAIGKWTGVPLADVLGAVGLRPEARFIVFHCADDFRGTPYYESIDLVDAFHPQTILAYGMNGADLPRGHGAPLRLRVERQLGYKHAKFIMRIEAVAGLGDIGRGQGGFWEDVGDYDWYAGI
jgi:DMSO/TMAO reductase YedYZ molybdopterin-dependent catalytic subunit